MSWRMLLVHALAVGQAEPGGSCLTMLLGLRRTKKAVSSGRHGLTPVPSPLQENHLPEPSHSPCPSRPTQRQRRPTETLLLHSNQPEEVSLPIRFSTPIPRDSSPSPLPGSLWAPAFPEQRQLMGHSLHGLEEASQGVSQAEEQSQLLALQQSKRQRQGRNLARRRVFCFSSPAPLMAMDSRAH